MIHNSSTYRHALTRLHCAAEKTQVCEVLRLLSGLQLFNFLYRSGFRIPVGIGTFSVPGQIYSVSMTAKRKGWHGLFSDVLVSNCIALGGSDGHACSSF